MGKVTKVVPHLSAEEIRKRIEKTVGFRRVPKWLVILNAIIDPRPAEEIARHTNLPRKTVHNLVCQYNRFGPQVLEGPGKGRRRNAYLTLKEEEGFLRPFFERAAHGQIATGIEIKNTLEVYLGRKVHKTTVYRMLKRNGWRKIAFRPNQKSTRNLTNLLRNRSSRSDVKTTQKSNAYLFSGPG